MSGFANANPLLVRISSVVGIPILANATMVSLMHLGLKLVCGTARKYSVNSAHDKQFYPYVTLYVAYVELTGIFVLFYIGICKGLR